MKGNPGSQKVIPSWLARVGVAGRQPTLWIAITLAMAALGGARGRRAALRGSTCFLIGSAVGNLPKPLFGRPQPRHRWARKPQVARGAFPSGHAAAEVAYVFGASQELPVVFWPLSAIALAAHSSLIKEGKHFVSDQLVGGTIGIGIAALAARVRPPHNDATRVVLGRIRQAKRRAAAE